MPSPTDQRPPVAVGHVRLNVVDVGAAARWLETVGLRPIVTRDELAVLELRGGTHVVVRHAEQPPTPGTGAPGEHDEAAAHGTARRRTEGRRRANGAGEAEGQGFRPGSG